jgi:hypothetical protein
MSGPPRAAGARRVNFLVPPLTNSAGGRRLPRLAPLWLLFFAICIGLGYPGVHRYDVRRVPDTADSRTYLAMVERPVPYPAGEDFNRVLLPLLAKPIYTVVHGRLGSWDPAAFSLLCVNSAMVATAALLLYLRGRSLGGTVLGLTAAALLLVDFVTPNDLLSGLVDAGELCFLMAVSTALFMRRWWLLPVLAVLGAAAKETFVLTSFALGIGWLVATWDEPDRHRRLAWVAAMAAVGFATATALMTWNRQRLYGPWNLASSMSAGHRVLNGAFGAGARALINHGVVEAFIWLLPLALFRLRSLPRPWVIGIALAGASALLLCAFGDARSNSGRILFIVVGPLFCLSAAKLLTEVLDRTPNSPGP